MIKNLAAVLFAALAMFVSALPGKAADSQQQLVTQNLAGLVAQQVYRCWNPPIAEQGGKGIIVRLNVHLSVDGQLTEMPTAIDQLDTSDLKVQAALRAAMRAIYACAPYKLPVERYAEWKHVVVAFDPRSL